MGEKRDSFAQRIVKALAREFDVELAQDQPGAFYPTPVMQSVESADAPDPLETEAKALFDAWSSIDPFPEISPSLLNAADIDDYMRATAMVFPYDASKRKTASYPLKVGTEIAYWDPKAPNTPPIKILSQGDKVTIPSNSLIYVRTSEMFQLPDYMAVRFNLHIDLVHKGLLLGTGPLVDPGFRGRLMVPLHNLTSNDYILQVGEDFIWVEFTKTSMTHSWLSHDATRPPRSGSVVRFEKRKKDKSLAEYIWSAQRGHLQLQPGMSHVALQNAIPDAIEKTRQKAANAKRSAAKAKRRATQIQVTVSGIGLIALLGAGATLFSQFQASRSAMQTTVTLASSTNSKIEDQARKLQIMEGEISALKSQISSMHESYKTQGPPISIPKTINRPSDKIQ